MFLRKHWNKFLIGVTAFFWAGCGDDPVSSSNQEPPVSSAEQPMSSVEESSSSEVVPESSAEQSSSSAAQSSSSVEMSAGSSSSSSSLSMNPGFDPVQVVKTGLKLAGDATVTCDYIHDYNTMTCLSTSSSDERSCSWYRRILGKEGYFLADSLAAYEKAYQECYSVAAPDYGVVECNKGPSMYYKCSNGKIYQYAIDGLVMTYDEYQDILDSGIVTQEPEEGRVYSCAHGELDSEIEIDYKVQKEMALKIKGMLANDENLSQEYRACLETTVYPNLDYDVKLDPKLNLSYKQFFKTMKCSDGTISETEEYKDAYSRIKKAYEDELEKTCGTQPEN